ncbi:MAG TPA: dipeptide epimerase [Bacteroidota bacterium]|nr:dipeptide epimerase [Bacteroidota bacterium]
MKFSFSQYDLQLKHAFTISRSSDAVRPVVLVRVEHEGIIGFGEAAPIRRYGESIESVVALLKAVQAVTFDDPFQLESILSQVESLAEGNHAAKAAIDIALHDWIGKKLQMPLHRLWGLADKTVTTSFTIGLDRPEIVAQKVREAEEFPILKIKLGREDDGAIIRTIRAITKKPLRVDANEAWTKKEEALDKIKWLEQEGVEFVEQPMPAHQLADTAWVHERVSVPLIADENAGRLHDIPKLCDAFDGINIKLMKCTGLREAMKMIHAARALGLRVMIGCMIETSVGISAASQLTPLVDYVDLDGNLLTTNDPFEGMKVVNGRVHLPERPGIGAIPRQAD